MPVYNFSSVCVYHCAPWSLDCKDGVRHDFSQRLWGSDFSRLITRLNPHSQKQSSFLEQTNYLIPFIKSNDTNKVLIIVCFSVLKKSRILIAILGFLSMLKRTIISAFVLLIFINGIRLLWMFVRESSIKEFANNFWSSSPNANNASNAWQLNFNNGNDNNNNRNNSNRVRLVRLGV